jgi:hypothetical protein
MLHGAVIIIFQPSPRRIKQVLPFAGLPAEALAAI